MLSPVRSVGSVRHQEPEYWFLRAYLPPCDKGETSQCAREVLEKEPRIIRLSCSADLLKSLPPFSSLTDAQFAAVLPSIQRRKYAARTYILEAGQRSDGLYVVLSGSVRLLLHDAKGRELIAGIIGPNEFFGEAGVSDSGPLATSVRSQEACELLYVPNKTVLKVFQYDPTTAVVMLRTVIDRLSDAHRKMATLAMVDVYGRVARFLLEYARETNGEWIVDTGSHGIAAMVGCSREMVTRVTKDMIKKGLVRRHGRQLIVLDRVVLANTSKSRKY